MKTWILAVVAFGFVGCASSEKPAESAPQPANTIPESMECPASIDPSQGCPSPSKAAVTLEPSQDKAKRTVRPGMRKLKRSEPAPTQGTEGR